MCTIENYSADILKCNFKETGLYKESILNKITSFHVTNNYSVDIMHDLFEGVCHYDMCHIIKYYTETVKLFSLQNLNDRKNMFNYGSLEVGNSSPEILSNHLESSRLKMSAREMWTFVHFFSLMVGDLVPTDDEVWSFYLHLLKIIDILLSYSFNENTILLLKRLIKEHNENYIQLFNDTSKPKHHFLIHYPSIIKQSGPPRHFWCFRFEGKHKELKTYARVTSSRKNITLTLAKKFKFKFSNYLMNTKQINLILKEKHNINYNESLKNIIFNKTNLLPINYKMYSEVQYQGTCYKTDFYLSKSINIAESYLFEIISILIVNSKEVLILAKQIKLSNFNYHYHAYEVLNNPQIVDEFSITNIDNFKGSPLNTNKISSG